MKGRIHLTVRLLVMAVAALSQLPVGEAASNVVIWDTGTPVLGPSDLADRKSWRAVPAELFSLEAEPQKAASDPGYYGREYQFTGDAVVENRLLTAVFSSRTGVVIYGKFPGQSDQVAGAGGRKLVELRPTSAVEPAQSPIRVAHCQIVNNANDEVALLVTFADKKPITASFVFDRTGTVEIQPVDGLSRISIQGALDRCVAPTFVGDDLVYGPPKSAEEAAALHVPAENLLLGMLAGEDAELVLTWPAGQQQVQLGVGKDDAGQNTLRSIEVDLAGQSLYLTAVMAPGIWHREVLGAAYLEKDVVSAWKRPYPARWKTQLLESNVKTTFAFREGKGQVWRGVPGSYSYPVWFDGETANFHLSKKVPPKGEALIYCLEAQDTPLAAVTPADILKSTLGRQAADVILDRAGRKLRTHHRRGGEGVHRACTCGCTDAIQLVFAAGEESSRREFVADALADMNYFVEQHVARIDEYQRFAQEMRSFLESAQGTSPEWQSYRERLLEIVQQIPDEYENQRENMKSAEYAASLTRETMALTEKPGGNNLPAYMELLKAWRGMGGAQDYVIAHCHMVTRQLYQEAGYGCATVPAAVPLAREVMARCRKTLRNPDGYEIWANY